MSIHHSQTKKAERLGLVLTEDTFGDLHLVRAYYPKRNVNAYGVSAAEAIAQGEAMIKLVSHDDGYKFEYDFDNFRLVTIHLGGSRLDLEPSTFASVVHHMEGCGWNPNWVETTLPEPVEATLVEQTVAGVDLGGKVVQIERSANGVALDGAIAYSEGTPSADCPYSSEDGDEYENFIAWNEAWDAAADEATEEESKGSGSVVSSKYRAIYAEAGHPTHCGDWLAITMNNICAAKEGTNLPLFEEICGMNGVDTGKYKRSGTGWQGRLRMTGRNLLARRVYENDGKLLVPVSVAEEGFFTAPADWMATRKYAKVKVEANVPAA